MANTNSNGLAGITEERVLHDLQCYYGLSGKLKQLGSCQDINYRLTTSNHEKYVVKYLNSSISWDDINFQHQILDYLHSFRQSNTPDSSNSTPFLIPYPKKRIDESSTVVSIKDSTTGSVYHMCVLLFIEGDLLSDFKYLHPLTLREIGRDIAKFNQLLVTFPLSDDYARQSEWDMRKSYLICEARRSAIKDIALQEKMMNIVSTANDILKFHESSLRHQLIHGDLADYNIIAKKTDFDRPKIIGIIDFGDIVESWLIADLAVAIVPLLSKPNHNTMEIVTEVVRGFCSLTPLNESELNCLWHLILLRAILITINVISILEDDPNNEYLLDEKDLNLQVVETVLNIPIQYAVSAIRAAGGKPADGSSNDDLLYRHGLIVKESSPIKAVEVDFSCQNSAFHSGNWLERGTLASIIKSTINDALPAPSPLVSSPGSFLSSSPPTNANQTIFEVKYGNPWLTRSVFRSFEAPQSIATFSIYFLAKGTRIYAPWNAVARVTEDIQSLNLLISDLKRSTTASSSRTRSASGGFGSFSSSAPKVLELKNDQFTMVIYGLHVASPLVNFDSTWNVKAGDKIGEVNTESIEGYYSPIVVQIFATPNEEISLYKQVLPVSSYYPPLFVTAYEYEIYRLFTYDPIFLFTGHLAKASDISGKPIPPPAPTSEVEGKEKETEDALWKREQYVSACQEYYYKQDIFPPPQIERGYEQYLYDIYGRGYLDMVNNVAVVGHSHPRIANNVYQQLLKLNTNSRFIYSALGDYAEKILSHIPLKLRQEGKLNRVFFVNSGSEATDLALRIARSVVSERRMKTKQLRKEEQLYEFCRDVICVQGGYHGVTTASDEVSTTLNDNPRSLETRAAWIHLVPMPNHYRGLHRLSSNEYNEENLRSLATEYAGLVREKIHRLKESGIVPAAFIAEPLSGNAGGVILPPTYLAQVYEMIHEIGGLCINDEVQVGYGRLGNVFWGFEEHGIVPDIITMAKAAGNGHPLGFVVTSEQIAKEFYESQGSFFSSAGGGPVSCVVGSTVLSIIEEEELQANALEVGKYLNERLWAVQKKFPHIVGCIHGHGLYQGIEIIKPDGSIGVNNAPAPGTQEAYKICDRLLQLGVISHNTGDYSNVLKVKPPLCITREDADFFCEALEITLSGF